MNIKDLLKKIVNHEVWDLLYFIITLCLATCFVIIVMGILTLVQVVCNIGETVTKIVKLTQRR